MLSIFDYSLAPAWFGSRIFFFMFGPIYAGFYNTRDVAYSGTWPYRRSLLAVCLHEVHDGIPAGPTSILDILHLLLFLSRAVHR
jgi:hypothetical protein